MTYDFVQATFDYGPRKGPALAFVVHMAEGGGTVGYLARRPDRGVSVHYVIEYSGRIVQMLREDHASGSINPLELRSTDDADAFYGATTARAVLGDWWSDPNSAVITVELEGFASSGPTKGQVGALLALVDDVRTRHPAIGLLGHRDFTSTKACPGRLIPWVTLGGHGPREVDMAPLSITSEAPIEVTVAAGTPYYDLDGRTVLDADGPSDPLPWRPSPFSVKPGWHAIYATVNGIRRIVLVKPSDTRVPSPCAPAVQAERDRVKAAAIAAVEGIA
jgi:hypothetical protein